MEKQGAVQAELEKKLHMIMKHIMSSSQPRNGKALDEQHSSIGEPQVNARVDDEPKLPTNEDNPIDQHEAPDAEPSASKTVVTPLTPIFDGVTAIESGDDEVISPEGRRLRKRGRCYQSPYVEFALKKKKAAFDLSRLTQLLSELSTTGLTIIREPMIVSVARCNDKVDPFLRT